MSCKAILAELRRQMNGAVSQTMRELGHEDYINLGVSLPTIKDIAMRYGVDHELACELAEHRVREARIAALYIADPERLSVEQAERWSEGWNNEEIARLSAMILFHRSPVAVSLVGEWLECGGEFRRIAALYMAGRVFRDLEVGVIERVLELGGDDSAMVFALREIYFGIAAFRDRILVKAGGIEDLRWQLEVAVSD